MTDQPVMHYVNLLGTFALFCAICWRLKHTAQPSSPFQLPGWSWDLVSKQAWLGLFAEIQLMSRDQVSEWAHWLVWAVCHIGVALCFLIVLLHQLTNPYPLAGMHVVIAKFLLAILMGLPWRVSR